MCPSLCISLSVRWCVVVSVQDPSITCFLLSIRSGAVGLNLTAATRVYLMEPAMNPNIEQQAITRIHRMGQTKACVAKKFIIRNSVEERIAALNEQRGQAPGGAAALASAAAAAVSSDKEQCASLQTQELEFIFS